MGNLNASRLSVFAIQRLAPGSKVLARSWTLTLFKWRGARGLGSGPEIRLNWGKLPGEFR